MVAASLQIGFQLAIRWGLSRVKSKATSAPKAALPPLSLVIAARNEASNLQANLPAFFDQGYPAFEVIVVDDGSTDDSRAVLEALQQRFDALRVVHITTSERAGGKKGAITRGIARARHECLVFTDADCVPADDRWLWHYGRAFAQGESFVIGTGLFHSHAGLVHALYQLDAARIAMFYLAAAGAGRPYMAVGRSMGYRKKLFDAVGGFSSHEHIASGDDDLFLQSALSHTRIHPVPEAMTLSHTPASWRQWLRQKSRHLQAGKHYPAAWVLLLGLYDLSWLITCLGLIAVWRESLEWTLAFYIIVILRLILFRANLVHLERLWQNRQGVAEFFFGDFLLSFWNPLLSVASQLIRRKEWRSRT